LPSLRVFGSVVDERSVGNVVFNLFSYLVLLRALSQTFNLDHSFQLRMTQLITVTY